MKLARPLCLLAVASICSLAVGQEAVVKIYARRTNNQTSQGTGFFSSDHGQIVTAYHVVEGATRLEIIHDRLGSFTDIQVDFISPVYDLAVLQIVTVPGTTPYFKLVNSAAGTADNLVAHGYPLGSAEQVFSVRTTRDGFVDSYQISDPRGRRQFQRQIDIIPLDMTIYSGMSGGPVLKDGQAIGVLSGSYQEGGSIAWAIPCKYITQLQQIRQKPDQIKEWPPLDLMASSWSSLRAMVRLNSTVAAAYDQYVDEVDALARAYDELHQQAQFTRRDISVLRPFLERVVSDPSLANDPEAASRLLEIPRRTTFNSIEKFAQLSDAVGTTGRQVAAAMSNIGAWITDQSNLDNRSGQELVGKIKAIRDQHKDMLHGLDSYLNVDLPRVMKSIPELALAMQRSSTPAGEARALLGFLNAWEPLVEAYASYQALTFMSGSISVFRQIGGVFEPIIYQAKVTH